MARTSGNKEVFLKGKCKFFKILGRGDVEYACWGTALYLTQESYAKVLEMKKGTETQEGIMNEIKLDDEGHRINLKRPWTRKTKGIDQILTPPIVIDKDGAPWPQDRFVGDGSDITVKCDYYTFKPPFKTKRGAAIRLVSVKIDDLVPYEPARDISAFEAEQVKGLISPTDKPIQYF